MPNELGTIEDNIKDLDRKLELLPKSLANKGARKATRAAAKVVLQDAQALAPVDEGQLEASLKVRARKRSRRNKGTVGHAVVTGANLFSGDAFYGGFVELGTENMDPDPFLRPALWGNRSRVRAEFVRVMREWFNSDASNPKPVRGVEQ